MKKSILSLALLISSELFAVSNCSFADNIVKYNGHYYGITSNVMEFDEAKAFAEKYGGYLAIPNNSAENNMLKGLIGGGDGAWIGVFDSSMSTNYCFTTGNASCVSPSRFKDIKGNNLSYSNWDSYEPNNFVQPYDVVDGKQMVSPLGEHWVVMNGNNGKWYDDGNHINSLNNPVRYRALIEFDSPPSCYQAESTVTDEWSTKMCNTQIWDSSTGNVEIGTTLSCQKDRYNNDYCPSALAPASESWDYENGFSTSGIGQVVDYTSKTGSSTTTTTIVGSGSWKFSDGGSGTGYGTMEIKASGKAFVRYTSYDVPKLFQSSTYQIPPRADGAFYYNTIEEANYYAYCESSTAVNIRILFRYGYSETFFDCLGTATVDTTACPSGYTATTGAETSKGQCKRTIEYTYYNYLCNNDPNTQGYNYAPITAGGNCNKTDPNNTTINSTTLDDACNSSTPPANNCARKEFLCQYNNERPPVWVNNQWVCSPFPCYGEESTEVAGTIEGANDKNNDGWSSDGSCAGQIYIFNGNDKRCRYWDMFFGLMGGGCCDKDKVFMGLVQCKENEKILAKKNKANLCHKVGTYCSKKLKLGFIKICVQKSESHCCFSSKIARAIHEQGRPQLGISWGSGDSPQCRGFTPVEFQKLDFSKIDLSGEFDIPELDTAKFSNTLNNAVTNLQNMLGN